MARAGGDGGAGGDAFNWGKIIRTVFKRSGGGGETLPLKEARKLVLSRYTKHLAKAAEGAKAPSSSEFKALFLEKVLATKRVRVEGKALWLERKA